MIILLTFLNYLSDFNDSFICLFLLNNYGRHTMTLIEFMLLAIVKHYDRDELDGEESVGRPTGQSEASFHFPQILDLVAPALHFEFFRTINVFRYSHNMHTSRFNKI